MAARQNLAFDQISFLAADVSSTAFNRPEEWAVERKEEVALALSEAVELENILNEQMEESEEWLKV